MINLYFEAVLQRAVFSPLPFFLGLRGLNKDNHLSVRWGIGKSIVLVLIVAQALSTIDTTLKTCYLSHFS